MTGWRQAHERIVITGLGEVTPNGVVRQKQSDCSVA